MSDAVLLIPNVAAEEGATWRAARGEATVREVVRLWRLLFGSEAHLVGRGDAPLSAAWPASLGPTAAAAALSRLDVPGGAFAWLNTREAAREAEARGRRLEGAAPEVVEQVHDKGFAHRTARREGLVPACLDECIELFDASDLGDSDAVVQRIDARLGRWPEWTRRDFALKPRFGSSGRGRVPGRSEHADTAEVRGALSRLAEHGGAVLEPWLERSADFSAQLWLDPSEGVVLLGTLELLVTRSGVYRGHRGTIDAKGRITSGLETDETLREAASLVAVAAREVGYRGPCGIDGFTFAGPGGHSVVRPVVELNARFTTGTIAIGLLRRALPLLRRRLDLRDGRRAFFHFALDAPPGGWPSPGDADDLLWLPLGLEGEEGQSALLIARAPEALDRTLERAS